MQRLARSTPLQLLALLAPATIAIGYATRSGITDQQWYVYASFVLAVPVFVAVVVATRRYPNAQAKEMDELAIERFIKAQAFVVVTIVDMLAVLFAGAASPKVALIILAAAAAWILVWSPRTLRRIRTRTSVVIQRDPSVVFAFVSDFENEPQYIPGIEVKKLTSGPVQSGSQFRSRMETPGGSSFEGTEEIVDYEPPTRLTSRVSSGRRPNFDVMTFDPVERGTLLTHRFDTELTYPSAIIGQAAVGWLAMLEMRSRRKGYWARLKQILESGPAT
jgi:uncharacterized protein YndB with AHSA1/START domain